MPTLPILTFDAPSLRTVSSNVVPRDIETRRYEQLIKDMVATCKVSKAFGLAANQVGVTKRIVVTNYRVPLVWVNPEIVGRPTERGTPAPEGCMSLPGKLVDVPRYEYIEVDYMDMHGNPFYEKITGTLAVILQHEIDHLNGVLITDYKETADDSTPSEH